MSYLDTDVRIDRVYILDIRHHTYSAYSIDDMFPTDGADTINASDMIWDVRIGFMTDGILWTLPTIHILHVTFQYVS